MADLGNIENTDVQDTEMLLKSLMEEKALEKWQQFFCDAANIFMCCVDGSGLPLTEFCGREEEAHRLWKIIDKEQLKDMLARVADSMLEEQAIETTAYPNLRMAVIPAKAKGQAVANWLVCGVLLDAEDMEEYENPPLEGFGSRISEKQFAKVVDALKAVTDDMLKYRLLALQAQKESRQSSQAKKEMKESLKCADALMDIVQFLDYDGPAERAAFKLLRTAGERLGLGTAAVYSVQRDKQRLRRIAWWYKNKDTWKPGKDTNAALCTLLNVKRALIVSGESMLDAEEKENMQKLGLKAVIVLPVETGKDTLTCACFGELEEERIWRLEEIKFLNACGKILHSMLAGNSSDRSAHVGQST